MILGDRQTARDLLGPVFGDNQPDNIVRFMAGRSPSECPAAEHDQPGSECIALVYEGIGAVAKIRDVLGPTDPSKAPPGSIRREFGSSIMVNAAHANDAPECDSANWASSSRRITISVVSPRFYGV